MTFNEWVKNETGMNFKELNAGKQQFHLLIADYENYCQENDFSPVWDY